MSAEPEPTTSVGDVPPPDAMEAIGQMARTDPLSHPLAFQLGCLEYEHPPPPHLIEIHCTLYEAITGQSNIRHIARIMPREHGKSEIGAHVVPVWAALRDPSVRILLMSHNESEAKAKLSKCASTLRELAPEFGLGDPEDFPKDNARELTLPRPDESREPTIRAAGMKSGVTGGHYDIILWDDMVDWDMQRTEDRRDKYVSKFEDYQNLGSGGDSLFLVLGTRKHPEDIYSHILSNPVWDSVVAKAIEDWSIIENYEYRVVDTDGNEHPGKRIPANATIDHVIPERECDVLWPDHWSLSDLIKKYLSSSEGSLVWKRENQNDAQALVGQILSEGMLTYENLPDNLTVNDLVIYVGVDLGIEDDPEEAAQGDSDYWAIATFGYDIGRDVFYMLDVTRRRGITAKAAAEWLKSTTRPYNTRNIYVEQVQAQRFFVQACEDIGLHVEETQVSGDKEDRIVSMSALMENGRVRIPTDGTGPNDRKMQAFINEWSQFPTADHDDMLDAAAHALNGRGEEQEERTKTSLSPFV